MSLLLFFLVFIALSECFHFSHGPLNFSVKLNQKLWSLGDLTQGFIGSLDPKELAKAASVDSQIKIKILHQNIGSSHFFDFYEMQNAANGISQNPVLSHIMTLQS